MAKTTNLATLATAEETSDNSEVTPNKCRPFIKWAGGKTRILNELTSRLPITYGSYFEPFVGGGALFFSVRPERACLSDNNEELINCYSVLRDNVGALIESLRKHRYEKEYYYAVRNIDRSAEYSKWSSVERASRMIYLNKCCYNGLYRVNSRGHFNVPFGRYDNPTIVNEENLSACSEALQEVDLCVSSFSMVLERVNRGDFVYFDPPYVPLSNTASFTTYTQEGFSLRDHFDLFKVCKQLDEMGVNFALTNSYTTLTLDLYRAFDIEIISAPRAINSKASHRGSVKEVLVRNY